MLHTLANNEQFAIKINPRCACRIVNKELTERWHHFAGRCAKTIWVHRNIAPSQWAKSFFFCNGINGGRCPIGITCTLRKKCHASGISTCCRKVETRDGSEKCVRNLDENACTVARVWLCTRCTAMLHIGERGETKCHNFATANSLDVGNERHTACVVFETWVVQTMSLGEVGIHVRLVLYRDMQGMPENLVRFSRDDAGPSNR